MTALASDDALLVAFADNELDPVTARLVADRVAADPALARRVAMLRDTADLLRAALAAPDQLTASPALVGAVTGQLDAYRETRPSRMAWRRRAWLPMAAAAVIAGFIIGDSGVARRLLPAGAADHTVVGHVLDEIADYHPVFAADKDHLVEVPAARRDHLEAWLGAKLRYAFKIPDLAAQGLTFEGGRMLAIDRQPVAQLMYTAHDGSVVALCIALTDEDASSGPRTKTEDGLTLIARGEGHHVFVIVGPRDNPSLRAVADAMPGLFRPS